MSSVFATGQRVRLSAAFANSAGSAADPTDVVCKYRDPRGVSTTKRYSLAEVTKDSTGNYHVDVDLTIAGQWFYRFEGTGVVVAANEAAFTASPTVFG